MFLAFIAILALLGPFVSIPTVKSEGVNGNLLKLAYQDIIFAPFATPTPLQLYQVEYPQLVIPSMKNLTPKPSTRKNAKSFKSRKGKSAFSDDRYGPPRMSRERNTYKDYGKSSHHRTKASGHGSSKDSTKRNFYMSLLSKLLRPRSRPPPPRMEYSSSSSRPSSPPEYMHASAMSAPSKGWGKGGGHGGGISLLDLLLLKLTLLSLLGFLLNLLLNLASLFGFGFMTSTATYPMTMTTTEPATGTGTATTGQLTYPTAEPGWGWPSTASAGSGSGLGITSRTINSMAGNGWGWKSDQARIKLHIKLPHHHHGWGWNATNATTTTTTTTTTAPPVLPAFSFNPSDYDARFPSLTGNLGVADLSYLSSHAGARTRSRPKREAFKPYVDPITSLEVFAKAVLNSMESATKEYQCIEKIHCENNKHARVVGQWLDYFMPVYSFSLSFFGHRMGVHHSLFDHLRAIVLGATEANCRTHFPHCESSDKGTVK